MSFGQNPGLLPPPFTAAGRRSTRWGRRRSSAKSVEAEVNTTGTTARDVLLVALTVAAGAVDAISYFGLGKIFSAFMTGNMVFLGFGIANIEGPDVVPVIVALSMFTAGAYVGLRFTTLRSNESGLWPPAVTALLVLVAVFETSLLVV